MFTLIELLVVIAIIAILASMWLPALKSARDRSKQQICVNRLKQVGLMMGMYANDFDGWMPAGNNHTADGFAGWNIDTFWFSKLIKVGYLNGWSAPQVLKEGLLRCPSEEYRYDPSTDRRYWKYPGSGSPWIELTYRETLLGIEDQAWNYAGYRKVGRYKKSSITPLFVDGGPSDLHNPGAWSNWRPLGDVTYEMVAYLHTGAFNVLFLDGHAKSALYGSETANLLYNDIK